MNRKFAKITYSQSRDEIPIKYNVIKKSPKAVKDWYVKKYNPFKMEGSAIAGAPGYIITLPLTEDEIINDAEKTGRVLDKTVEALTDYNVDIVLAPNEVAAIMTTEIKIADGAHLFPFFMIQATKKAIKATGKDLQECEFLIFHEDDTLTELIIDNIYSEVNFLTVIANTISDRLSDKAEDVLYDTGLNIRFSKNAKAGAETADIIINAAREDNKLDYSYKRGAIYFDLLGDPGAFRRLLSRRVDMLLSDGLKISCKKESFYLPEFEAALYLTNKEYHNILSKEYSQEAVLNIMDEIKKKRASVTGFRQGDKTIPTVSLLG